MTKCDDCGKKLVYSSEIYSNETSFGSDGEYCQDCYYKDHYDYGDEE